MFGCRLEFSFFFVSSLLRVYLTAFDSFHSEIMWIASKRDDGPCCKCAAILHWQRWRGIRHCDFIEPQNSSSKSFRSHYSNEPPLKNTYWRSIGPDRACLRLGKMSTWSWAVSSGFSFLFQIYCLNRIKHNSRARTQFDQSRAICVVNPFPALTNRRMNRFTFMNRRYVECNFKSSSRATSQQQTTRKSVKKEKKNKNEKQKRKVPSFG